METKMVFISIFLFVCIGFAVAVSESGPIKDPGTNATFGSCVVKAVKIRQDCFAESKNKSLQCLNAAKADGNKEAGKQCVPEYKQEKRLCKADFKASKKSCLQLYKPRFWEKMRYALK